MVGLAVTNIRKSDAYTGQEVCSYSLSISNSKPAYSPTVDPNGSFNLYKSATLRVSLNTNRTVAGTTCLATVNYVNIQILARNNVTGAESPYVHPLQAETTYEASEWYWNQEWLEFGTYDNIKISGYVNQFSGGTQQLVTLVPVFYNLHDIPSSPTPSPTPSPMPNPTPSPVEDIDNQTEKPTTVAVDKTQLCIVAQITKERYDAIKNNISKPTAEEYDKIQSCLGVTNSILPTDLSPVTADKVEISKLTPDSLLAVNKLQNVNKTDSTGNKKQAILISGKAKPNTLLFLYIFSDPIVVITSSDEDGNWKYTLEDPLKPGKHEVYAVVDRGNGAYKRSEAMPFTIGTAAATAGNPNGLSLSLADAPAETPTQSTRGLVFYIVGSVLVLSIVLVGLYFVIKKAKKNQVNAGGTMTLSSYGTDIPNDDNSDTKLGQ